MRGNRYSIVGILIRFLKIIDICVDKGIVRYIIFGLWNIKVGIESVIWGW